MGCFWSSDWMYLLSDRPCLSHLPSGGRLAAPFSVVCSRRGPANFLQPVHLNSLWHQLCVCEKRHYSNPVITCRRMCYFPCCGKWEYHEATRFVHNYAKWRGYSRLLWNMIIRSMETLLNTKTLNITVILLWSVMNSLVNISYCMLLYLKSCTQIHENTLFRNEHQSLILSNC